MMLDERAEKKRTRRYRDRERLQSQSRLEVVRAVMQHRTGRDFVYWLLELGHIGRNPFTANALSTAFQCGEANVSQQIQTVVIEAAPEAYLKMIKEQEDDRRTLDTIDAADRSDESGEPAAGGDGTDEDPGTYS